MLERLLVGSNPEARRLCDLLGLPPNVTRLQFDLRPDRFATVTVEFIPETKALVAFAEAISAEFALVPKDRLAAALSGCCDEPTN